MSLPVKRIVVGLLAVAASGLAALAGAEDFSARSGEELFQRFCASCHGRTGEGNGPVAASLAVMVPDLTRIAARNRGTFPESRVFRIIDGREYLAVHGPRDMPVWGSEFWREQGADVMAGSKTASLITRLVEYVKSLQRAPEPFAPPG
jgi:mono/diheme cytochrome c family protein